MKHSCGAILYTYEPYSGVIGIILGLEGCHWLPFKGGPKKGETYEQAAIREIYEETCGLIKIDNVELEHIFSSKKKRYHIGLVYVDYDLIDKFKIARSTELDMALIEKKSIKFFPLDTILESKNIHNLTRNSILYYWKKLQFLSDKKTSNDTLNVRSRNYSIPRKLLIYDEKKKFCISKYNIENLYDNSIIYNRVIRKKYRTIWGFSRNEKINSDNWRIKK